MIRLQFEIELDVRKRHGSEMTLRDFGAAVAARVGENLRAFDVRRTSNVVTEGPPPLPDATCGCRRVRITRVHDDKPADAPAGPTRDERNAEALEEVRANAIERAGAPVAMQFEGEMREPTLPGPSVVVPQ